MSQLGVGDQSHHIYPNGIIVDFGPSTLALLAARRNDSGVCVCAYSASMSNNAGMMGNTGRSSLMGGIGYADGW